MKSSSHESTCRARPATRRALTTAALLATAALATTGCTRPNPAVCCLDAADCSEVGIPEVRGCAEGLACVDHQCTVPSCAQAGCGANAPVCNVTTDVCDPCTDSGECSRFTDTPVCDTSSGGCVQCLATTDCASPTPVCDTSSATCVECLGSSDCPPAMNICDANACRAPQNDDECSSGAFANGGCVTSSDVVYLDPNGSDVGSCTRQAPCRTLAFAVTVTSASRNHVVFAPGQYNSDEEIFDTNDTTAPSLHLHGHGAEVIGASGDGCLLRFQLDVTIQDLQVSIVTSAAQSGICLWEPATVERVTIVGGASGGISLSVATAVTARDLRISSGYIGISVGSSGALVLDRAVLHTLQYGISGTMGSSIQASNVLVYKTRDLAVSFDTGSFGSVVSSTIVTDGVGVAASTRGVACATGVFVRSSIVWTPNSGALAPIAGCSMMNVIAGPTEVPGAMNVDPMFRDIANDDYHLSPGSPARDAVTTGPATDYEGQARPQGASFDIGADEAPP